MSNSHVGDDLFEFVDQYLQQKQPQYFHHFHKLTDFLCHVPIFNVAILKGILIYTSVTHR